MYEKVVTYHFEAGGEDWAMTSWSEDFVKIEELRKNGQEDCHVYAQLEKKNGKWRLCTEDPDWEEAVEEEYGKKTAKEVEDFLNKYGIPENG